MLTVVSVRYSEGPLFYYDQYQNTTLNRNEPPPITTRRIVGKAAVCRHSMQHVTLAYVHCYSYKKNAEICLYRQRQLSGRAQLPPRRLRSNK